MLSMIISWLGAHSEIVVGALVMGVNEIVRLLPGIKSNSIMQLVWNLVVALVNALSHKPGA